MVNSNLASQPPLSQAIFINDIKRVRELILSRENVNGEDTEGRSPLHAASFIGNAEIADHLILTGARVDKKDGRWQTPLHYACARSHYCVVETLITHNADVNQKDRSWQMALHICAANNAIQCAEFLLPLSSKNINMGDRAGRSPLHYAAFHGHMEMVELLLRYQADVNTRDKSERRPLHLASYAGHAEVVKQLVKAGADVGGKDKNLATALHYAAAGGHDPVCSYLLSEEVGRNISINAIDKNLNTPLHVAVNNGKESAAKILLEHGALVNAKNSAGMTPLHLAAASTEGSGCVDLLIENKADVNMKANDGRTPLHMLASYCRLKQAHSLIYNGANVNATDKQLDTALHIASRYGHDLLIMKLISAGADVKACNSRGITPLHLACYRGCFEPVKNLIDGRADIFAVDNNGRNCLHFAAFSPHKAVKCIEYLLENGASVASTDESGRYALHYASMANSPDHVECLLKAGSDVNAPDVTGRQALHYAAAQESDTRCAFLLLQHGAIAVCHDTKGWTPLHYACYRGHATLAEYFVSDKHGDNVENLLKRLPCSPLHLAAHRGHGELLEMLLGRTSRPDARDRFGFTPLHWATYAGQIGCVKNLLHSKANCLAVDKLLKTTPMHITASFRQTPILRMMISQYLNDPSMVSAFDCKKRTPVMMSVSSGAAESVVFLLSLKPDVTLKDSKGRSALHRAVCQGSEKITEMILHQLRLCNQQDKAVFARDDAGRTPFHYAAMLGHAGILAMLIREVPSDIQVKQQQEPGLLDLYDTWGQSPLHWSCFNGAVDCVELLLDSPVKFHLWEERGGITALLCAAHVGSEVCCELLFERGMKNSVDKADDKGRTPLHLASSRGHLGFVRILLAGGAFVDAVDQKRMTPIMLAARKGRCEIIEKLVEAKADCTMVDVHKRTVLHHACLGGHEDAATMLMNSSNSILLNCQDHMGRTALHIAGKAGLVGVVEKLLIEGASPNIADENDQMPAAYCTPDQNVANCLEVIICGMFPESVPISRLSYGSAASRLSSVGQNIIDARNRNSGDKVTNTAKETTRASSAQSSDSEFF